MVMVYCMSCGIELLGNEHGNVELCLDCKVFEEQKELKALADAYEDALENDYASDNTEYEGMTPNEIVNELIRPIRSLTIKGKESEKS